MKGFRPFRERRFRLDGSLRFAFRDVPFSVKGPHHSQHKTKQGEEDKDGEERQFPEKRMDGGQETFAVYMNQDAPAQSRVSMSDVDLSIRGDDGSPASKVSFFDEAVCVYFHKCCGREAEPFQV